jgi:hypothetical protein
MPTLGAILSLPSGWPAPALTDTDRIPEHIVFTRLIRLGYRLALLLSFSCSACTVHADGSTYRAHHYGR